jgi:hypothetical protein
MATSGAPGRQFLGLGQLSGADAVHDIDGL